MTWYYEIRGSHVHVNVFMDGANCGQLCFTIDEWHRIKDAELRIIDFIEHGTRLIVTTYSDLDKI